MDMKFMFSKESTFRQFISIFLPLFFMLSGGVLLFYYAEAGDESALLKKEALHLVNMQQDVFRHEFQLIVSDLMVLSEHHLMHKIMDRPSRQDLQALSREFLVLSANKKAYDQVRYLDATGMEIIRVNFNNGVPVIVPAEQLQPKGNRYYFADSFKLNQGEIFVSPFDLNIERGKIEYPLKPMIRFAMPVFDRGGRKHGVLILNYFGKQLIDHLKDMREAMNTSGSDMLLNSEGYWLHGPKDEDEWGFMLRDRKSRIFANDFPQEWKKITAGKSGQFTTGNGIFTFETLYPLIEGLRSSTGSAEAFGSSAKRLSADGYYWKLVSYVPAALTTAFTDKLFKTLFPFMTLFTLLLAVGVWFLARANVKRARAENEIKHMAHFDMLTELANRPLLQDRVQRLIAQAKRNKQSFALMFLDLDGFKAVNDTFGHEVGDSVLQVTAQRLQSCVREMDTAARVGGDEFVLLITEVNNPQDARQVAEKVIALLGQELLLQGQQVSIGASVGIALYPVDGDNMDALIVHADTAMYLAKAEGKNNYRFYGKDMSGPVNI
jgi:diguanylate cyclase (GGDEF)-like protein